MTGLILAAGCGTRLYPVTKFINKHFLPIFDNPMIIYPINALIKSGVHEIIIVTNNKDVDALSDLISIQYKKINVNIKVIPQIFQKGIVGAILSAEKFISDKKTIVILGDNVFTRDFREEILDFKSGAILFLKNVADPQQFGVAKIVSGKISFIKEKPKKFISNSIVLGIYIYDENLINVCKLVSLSDRKELEITDVNNYYINNFTTDYKWIETWFDCGTFENILSASCYIKQTCLQK